MVKPFHELRERLLRAGIAPRHVRRYLAELADHLADLTAEEQRAGHADAQSAALLRLGGIDALSSAMIKQRRLQSWSIRAPWAVFGLAPVVSLAVAYFVAFFILWSGWKIFLPEADTPFGSVQGHGFANAYFQVGKMLYYTAPILIGWGVGLVAARQRFKAAWPTIGLVLIALIGCAIQVHASRTAVSGGLGHISVDFTLGASAQAVSSHLSHALASLSFTALPYLLWRLRTAHLLFI